VPGQVYAGDTVLMARSQYIYMIVDQGLPPLGFTVKHEMTRWLRHHPDPGGRVIWRGRDGVVKSEPVVLSIAELLGGDSRA
jgi:hypothetical protein